MTPAPLSRTPPGRDTAPTDVRGALEAVTGAAPHLRWRIAADHDVAEPGELSCAALAADPDLLAAAVAASAAGRGSDDPQVLASLWWQAYAYRVAGTALACWLLSGIVPDVRAERMGVGVARSRPSSVVYLSGAASGDLGLFVDRLFAGHLDLVAASLRARHPMGAQLVWGNVAAACASGVGAVHEAAAPDWPDRLATFLAAAPHRLAALGQWSFADSGPAFRRRTCCLWWKTTVAEGALCADCSLHRRPAGDTEVPAAEVVAQQPLARPKAVDPPEAPTPGSTPLA